MSKPVSSIKSLKTEVYRTLEARHTVRVYTYLISQSACNMHVILSDWGCMWIKYPHHSVRTNFQTLVW